LSRASLIGISVLATFVIATNVAVASGAHSTVKVITWNVHGIPFTGAPSRLERIAAEVSRRRPDFALFEEVWFRNQALVLRSSLERHGYVAIDYNYCVFRRGGLLMFIDSRAGWSLVNVRFTRYSRSAPWWRLSEWDGLGRKGFLQASLRNHDETELTLVVTHLQSQYPNHHRSYDEVRVAQLQQLLEAIGNDASKRTIIAGDFNTTPDEPSHGYQLLAHSGWTDTTVTIRDSCQSNAESPCGTSFSERAPVPSEWIDYIFTTPAPQVSRSEMILNRRADDPYSDHEGLESTIHW
jgi:endonuclease/exonuclease/phosphatase family metal-dependent hydrolase